FFASGRPEADRAGAMRTSRPRPTDRTIPEMPHTRHPAGDDARMNSLIRLLVLDVDGVLTDGTIFIDDAGRQMRGFHIQDGLGITLWKAVGGQVAILTSKRSEAVMTRARMLGIERVEQGAEDKLPGFERILAGAGVRPEETAYVGDDLL